MDILSEIGIFPFILLSIAYIYHIIKNYRDMKNYDLKKIILFIFDPLGIIGSYDWVDGFGWNKKQILIPVGT